MAGILNIQFTPKSADKAYNLECISAFISQYCDKNLDLVVMPEFFSTSIDDNALVNNPEPSGGGIVIDYLSKIAKRFSVNIVCGSVMELEDGKLYNTSYVLNRQGDIVGKYRKIHLFGFFGGNEDKYTHPGTEPLVVDLDFAKVGVSLCFDIKFPMLYKELIRRGAEIIVSPSAWSIPISASQKEREVFTATWQAMNICRATESLIYFVTSNLTRRTNPFCDSIGNSMITGPMGEVIANAGSEETAVFAELDMDIVREYKKTVPVYKID